MFTRSSVMKIIALGLFVNYVTLIFASQGLHVQPRMDLQFSPLQKCQYNQIKAIIDSGLNVNALVNKQGWYQTSNSGLDQPTIFHPFADLLMFIFDKEEKFANFTTGVIDLLDECCCNKYSRTVYPERRGYFDLALLTTIARNKRTCHDQNNVITILGAGKLFSVFILVSKLLEQKKGDLHVNLIDDSYESFIKQQSATDTNEMSARFNQLISWFAYLTIHYYPETHIYWHLYADKQDYSTDITQRINFLSDILVAEDFEFNETAKGQLLSESTTEDEYLNDAYRNLLKSGGVYGFLFDLPTESLPFEFDRSIQPPLYTFQAIMKRTDIPDDPGKIFTCGTFVGIKPVNPVNGKRANSDCYTSYFK